MSELLILAHDTESAGFALRDQLEALRREGMISAQDIVLVTREPTGDVRLHQEANTTAMGAVGGAVWGGLLGLVFMAPVIGAAIGAGAGAVAGHATDLGINDGFLHAAGESLPEGGSAVFVLLHKGTAHETLDRLHRLGHVSDRVLQTRLEPDFHDRIETALREGGTTALTGREISQGSIGDLARIVGPSAL